MKFSVNEGDMYVSQENDLGIMTGGDYYIFGNVPKKYKRKLINLIFSYKLISIEEGSGVYKYKVLAKIDDNTYILEYI